MGSRAAETPSTDTPSPSTPDTLFASMSGIDSATYTRERPGTSALGLEDGVVHHNYSAYARGLDALWGCANGSTARREDAIEDGVWWRRHDEYDKR